jgi:hypothetical protein
VSAGVERSGAPDATRMADLRRVIAAEGVTPPAAAVLLAEAIDRIERYEALLRRQREACGARVEAGECFFCAEIHRALQGAWS